MSSVFVALLAVFIQTLPAHAAPPKNLQIYILMGQSNMVGRDPSTLSSQIDNPQILALNDAGQWVVAREPMQQAGIGIGPGISFAREMLKADPKATIGLVPCAVSGTHLSSWVKGAYLYQAALNRALAAAPVGTIRGVLWHQGEADSVSLDSSQTYEAGLTQMFRDFRQDLGHPNLPIVVGQLGDFLTPSKFPGANAVRGALFTLPNDLPHVGFAPSTGLTDWGDKIHFNAVSQGEFGVRYAAAMQALQNMPGLDDATFTFDLGQSIGGMQLQGHASAGNTPTYSVTDGTLPDGVTLNSDGRFSGTPTATTSGVDVTVTVSDGSGFTSTARITIRVQNFRLIVNTTADSSPGSDTDNDDQTSLREAIAYANANTGADTISFDATVFSRPQTIALDTALPSLSDDVAFAFPGANLLTLTPVSQGGFNLLNVAYGVRATFSGLTIANGQTGISNAGTVTVTNCTLSSNGTGIDNQGTINLTNCTLSGNSTGIANAGVLTAVNCTVAGNSSVGFANQGTATASNCTVSGNASGISNAATLTLNNCLAVGNAQVDITGGFTGGGHNLTTGTTTEAGLDPAGLQNNGGPTATVALLIHGAAVDRGDNALVPSDVITDQRGAGHERILGNTVDIGAFEVNPDEAPTDIALSKNTVAENAGANASVGVLTATDPDVDDTFTFSLPTDLDDNAQFSLFNNNQLRASSSFDYEIQSSYVVTVRVTDSAQLSFDKQFIIVVTEATKPTISLITPGVNEKITISDFVKNPISGLAQDNVGVAGVKVRIYRKRGTAYAYWNGTDFGAAQATVNASVTGTADASWVLSDLVPPAEKLDAGAYQIRVYAYDAAGNQSDLLDRAFTLGTDFTPPTINVAAPTTAQKMLVSSFLVGGANGSAADAVGVVGVKVTLSRKSGTTNLYWNGTDFTTASVTVDAELSGTLTAATWKLNRAALTAEKLPVGGYALSAYAVDAAGNKSVTASVAFTLGTDFTAPTISIASPTAAQKMLVSSLMAGGIGGTAADAVGVTGVKLTLSRKSGTANVYWNGTDFTLASATVDAELTGTTDATWRLVSPALTAEKLPGGAYLLSVYGLDAAGNKSPTSSVAFTLGTDFTAPTINIAAPTAAGKMLISSLTAGGANGVAADAVGVVGVKVTLSRKSGTTNLYWNGSDFTSASATVDAELTGTPTNAIWKLNSPVLTAEKLPVGAYALSAYAVDAAGNKSVTASVAFTLGTDFTAPTVEITSPTSAQKVLISSFIAGGISGSAADAVGVVAVNLLLSRKSGTTNLYWNGTDFTPLSTMVNADLTGPVTSATWNYNSAALTAEKLPVGGYAVSVYGFDAVGNKSVAASTTFTLGTDFTAPTINIAAPTSNQKTLISSFIAAGASGNAADAVGVTRVKITLSRKNGTASVYWNGTDFTSASATVDADLTGTPTNAIWTLKSTALTAEKLSIGAYSLSVYGLDAAGNKSATATVTFSLSTDIAAPTVSVSAPTTNQFVNINNLGSGSIAGGADDNVGVSSVKVKIQRKRGTQMQYWNGTEFTATALLLSATVTQGSGTAVTWKLDQPIPATLLDVGSYTLYATAYDAAGNFTTAAARSFSVTGTAITSQSAPATVTAASAGGA